MNEKSILESGDTDLIGSLAAMERAARRAREEARRGNTDLIQYRDGKVVRVSPVEEPEEKSS